jgi:hypothetical protein
VDGGTLKTMDVVACAPVARWSPHRHTAPRREWLRCQPCGVLRLRFDNAPHTGAVQACASGAHGQTAEHDEQQPGMLCTTVIRGCRAKFTSSAAASGKPGGAGEVAKRCSVLRATITAPISTGRRVISQRTCTMARLDFTTATLVFAVTPRATPPMDQRDLPSALADNMPTARRPTTSMPPLLH